jgi:hypothetical protein
MLPAAVAEIRLRSDTVRLLHLEHCQEALAMEPAAFAHQQAHAKACAPSRWADEEDTELDEEGDTTFCLTNSSTSSFSVAPAEVDDLEGVKEQCTIRDNESFSVCDSRASAALSSHREAMECLVQFRDVMERDATISNTLLGWLWNLVYDLESAESRPKHLRQEESKVLQRAIQLAQASCVKQAMHELVGMVEQAVACGTHITWLFEGFFSNYIIQELCTRAFASDLGLLANALCPFAVYLAQNQVACRIMQRIFEHCSWEQLGMLPFSLFAGDFHSLCSSHFGGMVLSKAFEHHPQFCALVLNAIPASAAKSKSGSFVWEALIMYSPTELLESAFQLLAEEGLSRLLLDRYGVEPLYALAKRGLHERLAHGLRYSIISKHRSKSYARDLIKQLNL